MFQDAGADSAIFPGVRLPLTIHAQQSTNILFPVLQEASNNILWQEYAETCTG
jgi:hypothetical protein